MADTSVPRPRPWPGETKPPTVIPTVTPGGDFIPPGGRPKPTGYVPPVRPKVEVPRKKKGSAPSPKPDTRTFEQKMSDRMKTRNKKVTGFGMRKTNPPAKIAPKVPKPKSRAPIPGGPLAYKD